MNQSQSAPENNQDKKRGVAARKLAMEVLIKIDQKGAYTNIALANALAGGTREMAERDRAFVTALVQGVLRNKNQLDDTLAKLSSQPLKKIQPAPLNLLRLALFQLDHMEDIPQRAVVDTAVQIARGLGHEGIAKFTNAVLRSHLRQKSKSGPALVGKQEETDNLSELSNEDASQNLSRQFSLPPWLISRWLTRFGLDETLALLKAGSKPARLTLRVNDTAMETDGYERILQDKGVVVERSQLVPTCLVIKDRKAIKGPVEKLPGFDEGIFSVQDEAAAFVSLVVSPQAGDFVIDLCAAPGGKTLHMAELMENKGRILAVDKHEGRLNMVKENRQRLGLTNIETRAADGITFSGVQADKVLVDAPCTGTGVINKRSDIRFKLKAEDIEAVNKIQRDLMNNAANLVKPGGRLVYSTCSIEKEENEDLVDWFLAEHPQFEAEDLSECFGGKEEQYGLAEQARKGRALFLPSRHECSGFFVARLKRKSDS